MVAAACLLWGFASRGRSADDQPRTGGAANTSYFDSIDQVMDKLTTGRVDDVTASVESLKSDPAERDAVREKLVNLRNQQGRFLGYDLVSIQRFSDRLQRVDVLAFYERQPALFRFDVYHASGNDDDAWSILDVHVEDTLPDALEEMKDVPVDYIRKHGKSVQ
jgi:hypothetical protein